MRKIELGSQKQLGTYQHGGHPHPKCPTKRKRRTTQKEKGTLKILMSFGGQQKP
jgi:hypothetical protein